MCAHCAIEKEIETRDKTQEKETERLYRAGKPSLHNSSVIFVYGQHSKGGLVLATGKRIYWMKLRESFMTSDTVDYLMSLPNGSDYVILYQMLCLKTISTGGRLFRKIGEVVIKYDVPKIQRDLKWFSADTIRTALECFKSLGLVYEEDDGIIVLSGHDDLIDSETDYAAQKRAQQKSLTAREK